MHARARVSLSRLGYRRSACGAGQVQSAEAAEQGQVQSVALGRRFFGRQDRVGVRRRRRRVADPAAVAHSRCKRESCRRGSAPPVRLHGIARKVTNRPRSLPPSLRSPTPATVTHAGAPARAHAPTHATAFRQRAPRMQAGTRAHARTPHARALTRMWCRSGLVQDGLQSYQVQRSPTRRLSRAELAAPLRQTAHDGCPGHSGWHRHGWCFAERDRCTARVVVCTGLVLHSRDSSQPLRGAPMWLSVTKVRTVQVPPQAAKYRRTE
jgi:hypothetical protein